MIAEAQPTTPAPGRFLSFRLDREVFAVPILEVREIIELADIAPVPRAAPWVRGVVNLRGRVLPVIDPKVRLGRAPLVASELTVIVVLQPASGKPFALLVDEVLEVQRLEAEQISPANEATSSPPSPTPGWSTTTDPRVTCSSTPSPRPVPAARPGSS